MSLQKFLRIIRLIGLGTFLVLLWGSPCMAEPPPRAGAGSFLSLSVVRLTDTELGHFRGQGKSPICLAQEQLPAAIKLWDEWAKNPQSNGGCDGGRNQVVISGPHR